MGEERMMKRMFAILMTLGLTVNFLGIAIDVNCFASTECLHPYNARFVGEGTDSHGKPVYFSINEDNSIYFWVDTTLYNSCTNSYTYDGEEFWGGSVEGNQFAMSEYGDGSCTFLNSTIDCTYDKRVTGVLNNNTSASGTWYVKWTFANGCVEEGSGTWTVAAETPTPPNPPTLSITIPGMTDGPIEVSLDPGDKAGQNADWWLGVDTPAGWYCYDIYQGAWVPGFSFLVYQGPLFDLPPSELPAFSNMPTGTCTFYFGIDTTMNGQLDGNIYYDTLVVQNDSSMSDDWAPPFIGPDGDSDGSCHSLKFTPVGTTLSYDSIDWSLEFGSVVQITLLTTACGQPVTVSSVVNPSGGAGWLSAISGGGSKVILELDAGASGVQAGFTYTETVKVVAGGITDNLYVQLRVEGQCGGSYTNSLGMTFSLIPAGTFMMGSPESELGRGLDEALHKVTLTRSFYMQTTEVTQGQWETVMGINPSCFSECGPNCPAEEVSWNDAQDFIVALNSRGEGIYRLPTEAEWEYAARAGSTTVFSNGDITVKDCRLDPNLNTIGWYCGNTISTKPVTQKQPNAWGLYDMHGNVWEWVQDWHGSYPTTAVIDPTGPENGLARVIRGGGWSSSACNCRSANRAYYTPDVRHGVLGFRLLRLP
jgi:formylglycine-generating enzyme required for sulfatase activity